MINHVSQPEVQVLLACARAARDPAAREELRLLVERGIGWDRLREIAARHGMLVILAKRLLEHCPDSVPSQVMADLRRLYLQSTAESMRKVGECRAGAPAPSGARHRCRASSTPPCRPRFWTRLGPMRLWTD